MNALSSTPLSPPEYRFEQVLEITTEFIAIPPIHIVPTLPNFIAFPGDCREHCGRFHGGMHIHKALTAQKPIGDPFIQ